MNWARLGVAVIPCLNEASSIGALVAATRRHVSTVLVVDDGSSDETAAVAGHAGAQVVAHAVNRGKGAALRTGLDWAAQRGFRWALTLDGDGQHDPEDIPLFLAAAASGTADLVIGNRLGNPQALSLVRRWVNRWMSRRISRRVGFPCPDSQCGFRFVRLGAWAETVLVRDRYEAESEMLVAFAAQGRRILFVPVRCLPAQRPSRIRPVQDAWRWFRWWRGSRQGAAQR